MYDTLLHSEADLDSLDGLWLKFKGIRRLQTGAMEPQLIGSHALIIAGSGMGCLMIDLLTCRLSPGGIYMASPGQTVGVSAAEGDSVELWMLNFDVSSVSGAAAFPLKGEVCVHSNAQTAVHCELLLSYCASRLAVERFRAQGVFMELLYEILTHIRLLPDSDSRSALERTKLYIEQHYNESLSIEQLARMANLSPKYYVDLFKKNYGKSAIDYVTELRMDNAKQLMLHSDARLRDIAHRVGYQDEFYFSRKFKQEVGMSPTGYIKNRRRKIVAYSSPILGQLLSLKVLPYAAPLHPKWTGYYHKMYGKDIPLHLSAYRFDLDWESNIEALTRAEPDLIISRDDLQPEERRRLGAVAPVHFIPLKERNWREQLEMTAEVIGVPQEAASWLRKYELQISLARERLRRQIGEQRILVISIFKQHCCLCPARGMRELIYEDLRLAPAVEINAANAGRILDADQLAFIDADRILVNVCQEPESLAHWQFLQNASSWKDLKAVRQNRVYSISSDPWREYSAYAVDRMVQDLLNIFAGDL
ncbi:AraC family transcriptional regulator [Paenibacillus sp. S150]|uniref:AraC family transcriptional regulator n=1 Tax=Paenibacillus sp. S150 TaxID=2749826 RepID=UPI001C57CF0C|nr:AraC family transcriptional regulator [Paenibacillus sp. S150]MBW4082986.1 AraC family transcriptional regulator [Paenibacillus sp. S150]